MTSDGQHSPGPSRPSNTGSLRSWRALAESCREASTGGDPRAIGRRLLERLLDATGAERAFIVRSDASAGIADAHVELDVGRRADRRTTPSRTVLSRSLAGRRTVVYADAGRDPRLATGPSVRSLELRFVVTTPLPSSAGRRGALVLDSALAGRPRPELRELVSAFAALLALVRGSRAAAAERPEIPAPPDGEIVGRSRALRETVARAGRVAPWPFPVLVSGPSGSGKEGIARLLHRRSPRAGGPFVAVNCAALAETLLDSELFGAVRGAYTGLHADRPGLVRRAHGGTLLLDEVGDMSDALQAKLLRVLQESAVRPVGGHEEHAVDVRVVAATHRDLRRRVAEGRFRADLYYRLAVIELRTPALSERLEDLPLLVEHFSRRWATATRLPPPRWSPEALAALALHDWPGNVRELEAVVARAALHAGNAVVQPDDVDLLPALQTAAPDRRPLEAEMIEAALDECGGVVTRAAERIGWTRQKLTRRMTALGIAPGPRRRRSPRRSPPEPG